MPSIQIVTEKCNLKVRTLQYVHTNTILCELSHCSRYLSNDSCTTIDLQRPEFCIQGRNIAGVDAPRGTCLVSELLNHSGLTYDKLSITFFVTSPIQIKTLHLHCHQHLVIHCCNIGIWQLPQIQRSKGFDRSNVWTWLPFKINIRLQ